MRIYDVVGEPVDLFTLDLSGSLPTKLDVLKHLEFLKTKTTHGSVASSYWHNIASHDLIKYYSDRTLSGVIPPGDIVKYVFYFYFV